MVNVYYRKELKSKQSVGSSDCELIDILDQTRHVKNATI